MHTHLLHRGKVGTVGARVLCCSAVLLVLHLALVAVASKPCSGSSSSQQGVRVHSGSYTDMGATVVELHVVSIPVANLAC